MPMIPSDMDACRARTLKEERAKKTRKREEALKQHALNASRGKFIERVKKENPGATRLGITNEL